MRHVAAILSLLLTTLICSARVTAQSEWQTIAPLGESFAVSMPTRATAVTRRIPLSDDDWVPERVYYSLANGRRYMVVPFARPTVNASLALSNFNEFLRAMERSFTSRDSQVRSLTFDQDLSGESGIVKQYRLQLGDYLGVARFMADEKFFYAQLVIGAQVGDPDAGRFLRSFQTGRENTDAAGSGVNSSSELRPIESEPPEPWPQVMAPISGGILNGRAVHLERPAYPAAARKNHDQGQVKVRIVIDEYGQVISAEAIDGSESLRKAAVDAALKSRFTPTKLMGQPVKVSGVIIYNFVAQ